MFWLKPLLLVPYFLLAYSIVGLWISSEGAYRRLGVALALGCGWIPFSVNLLGRIGLSLPHAILASSLLSLIGFLIFYWRRGWIASPWKINPSWDFYFALVIGLLVCGFAIRIAFRFNVHDQYGIQAHTALIESIVRGNFPPHLIAFPEIPLKYHFGGDLFAAVLAFFFDLSAFRAIDWTQSLGFVLAYLCLFQLFRCWKLPRWLATLATLWVLWGAGWAYLLKPLLGNAETLAKMNYDWPDSYPVFGRMLNPGTFSNFFMLPYSLGLCLFFSFLLLFDRFLKDFSYGSALLMAVLLGMLSLIQVTFFFTLWILGSAVMGLAILGRPAGRAKTFLQLGIAMSLAWGLAMLSGGFSTHHPLYESHLLVFNWPPGYLKNATWGGNIPIPLFGGWIWYLGSLGSSIILFLPLGILAFRDWIKEKSSLIFLLTLYFIFCFVFVQLFRYRLTWDIIKWFTGFHLSVLILAGYYLGKFIVRPRWAAALIFTLMLLDITPSFRFAYNLALGNANSVLPVQRPWFNLQYSEPGSNLTRLTTMLKNHPWNEIALSNRALSFLLTQNSGQAMAFVDNNTVYFGVKRSRIEQRNQLAQQIKKNFQENMLSNSEIRWIAYPCQDYEKEFSNASKESLKNLVALGSIEDFSFEGAGECYKVLRLKPISPGQ